MASLKMAWLKWIALSLVLIPAFGTVQGKPKKTEKLPAIFNQATYFYVEAVDGDEFNPRLLPEDRQAIVDVEAALTKWNRYTLATRRSDADLVFVVRKGRVADADVAVSGGAGTTNGVSMQAGNAQQDCNVPQGRNRTQSTTGRNGCETDQSTGAGVGVGGEVGPPDDLFEVYVTSRGAAKSGAANGNGTLLWLRSLSGGLDRPQLALFKQFKDRVERDYPPQVASQPQKP
jgi:hypothetical protein